MRKDGGDHTTARPATADPFSIRPPPLPGIFGVPGSGSLIAKEPREVIRQAKAAIAMLVKHGWLTALPEGTEVRGKARKEVYRIARSGHEV